MSIKLRYPNVYSSVCYSYINNWMAIAMKLITLVLFIEMMIKIIQILILMEIDVIVALTLIVMIMLIISGSAMKPKCYDKHHDK